MSLRLKEMSIESYKSIIEYNPDAIFILSVDGMIMEVNQITSKILGFSKEELQEKHYEEILVPEYKEFTYQQYQAVLKGKSPEYETQLFHKNGDKIYLQVKNIPLWDNGEVVGIFGIGKDVTELHNTRATLNEMEKRMKALFYSTMDAIDFLDLDGNVLDVNPAFEKLYGWKREEIIGKKLPIIPEYRNHQQEELLEKAKLRKQITTMETTCIKKDGSPVEISLTFSPLLDKRGNLLGTAGITRDISERKQLEKLLRESEERYRKVVELSPKGIVIHRDGTIVYANPSALKMLKEDNAIGKTIDTYLHPDFKEVSKKRLSMAKSGEELPFVEMKMNCSDGDTIYAEITSVPFNYDGNPAILTMLRDVTERKNTEQKLEESKKRYERLVHYSPEPIVVHQKGIIQYINQAGVQLFGGTHFSEIVGKSILNFISPEVREIATERIEYMQQAEGNTLEMMEHKMIRLDGTPFYIEYTGVGILYEGEIAVQLLFRDITARKQAEEALLKSEHQYRLIADNMTDLVAVLDTKGEVKYASPSHGLVLGLSVEAYEGSLAHDIVHPEDVDKFARFFEEMMATKESVTVEFRVQNQKKEWLWFEATGSPVYDENGNLLHFLKVARDITERRQGEEDLRQSEELYRLIAENMTDLVCVIDEDVNVKYASPSHITVLGYPSNDYEGKCALDWVYEADAEGVKNQLESILESRESGNIEYRFKHINGNWIWFEANITPIFTEDGQFEHFLSVSREITERIMYEEKLTYLAFHDTLTGLPNRRLFKERLEQSLSEAERYERKMAVIFMDLDKFKLINDTLGHDVGDELLQQFSKRVQKCLRDSDTLSRQGGDEFTILLPEIQDEKDAISIAKRILDSLQQPWEIGEQVFYTTSSIGISLYPKDGVTKHELMKHADEALYQAKEDGRNNFKTYSSLT
ncbi:PAS domain S-box protein [Lysinibacillus sp. NPDC098008]|uniref:PAS domain S-box protein n=1 Tax=Lysinibacillus sp. NPDC098008 TaxID=3364146 RepID=UPI003818CCF1